MIAPHAKSMALACAATVTMAGSASTVQAVTVLPVPTVFSGPEFAPAFSFANVFDATVAESDLDTTSYGPVNGIGDAEWAGPGTGPHDTFMDFGAPITTDGFAYSQRSNLGFGTDKIGQVDFWFSDTDFGGVVPAASPDTSVAISNLSDGVLNQYTFGPTSFTSRYVAARFISEFGPNTGGSEFRLLNDVADFILPELTINRDTGEIVLSNNVIGNSLNFIAYSLRSDTAGALDSAGWSTIASRDANDGGALDSSDNWNVFSAASDTSNLSEGEAPGGDGLTLTAGDSVSFGSVWTQSPFEDVVAEFLQEDGELALVAVRYIGTAIPEGDFNADGAIDVADWQAFRANLGADNEGLSLAQAYQAGDLDDDGDTDLNDFLEFQQLFDEANGVGALQALVAVPEPASAGLVLGAATALLVTLRRRAAALLLGAVLTLGLSQSASAQLLDLTGLPAFSSGNFSPDFGPEFAFNGNVNDRWASAGPGNQWIYVDLGQDYNLAQIELDFEFASAAEFNVLSRPESLGDPGGASADPTIDWSIIASAENVPGTNRGGPDDGSEFILDFQTQLTTDLTGSGGTFDVASVTPLARYVMLQPTMTAGFGLYSVRELAVSVVPEPASAGLLLCAATALLVPVRRKAALLLLGVVSTLGVSQSASAQLLDLTGLPAFSSSNFSPDFGPEFAFNNDVNDRWASAMAGDQWIYVDLGQDYNLAQIEIDFEFASAADFNLLSRPESLGDPGGAATDPTVDWSIIATAEDVPATNRGGPADGSEFILDFQTQLITDLTGSGGTFDVVGVTPLSRYVMLQPTASANVGLYSVRELAVTVGESLIPPTPLRLEVHRGTGQVTVINAGDNPIDRDLKGYEILSEGNSLSSEGWSSLQDQDLAAFPSGAGDGDGWEEGEGSNASRLIEANLLGSSLFESNESVSLGSAYNQSVNAEDLMFSYSNALGFLRTGDVEYVGLAGDYNGDDAVDAADYTVWRDGLGDTHTQAGYATWATNFGASMPAAAASVPEPGTLIGLGTLALTILCVRRRDCGKLLALIAGVSISFGGIASAGTPDATYLFGDNSAVATENGADGIAVGTGVGSDFAGATLDHAGDAANFSTFRDIETSNAPASATPNYVDTAALSFPGTALNGTTTGIGIQFDGVDDRLVGSRGLGFPQNGDAGFTGDVEGAYTGILSRSMGGWVRPASLDGMRQDIINDTYQFGIHITVDNTWGMNFGSDFGADNTYEFDSGVGVAPTLDSNGWVHVQQRTLTADNSVLYINGEPILASIPGRPFYHGSESGNLNLVFGSNAAGDANFFEGTLDNFELLVAGDNSGEVNGQDYGEFDLLTDNDFVRPLNLTRGDANGDGSVNGDGTGPASSDDITFFIDNWNAQSFVSNGDGDLFRIGGLTTLTTQADFNTDGVTDLQDWFILRQNHVDQTALAQVDLGELIASRSVPEPTAIVAGLTALLAASLARSRRG